MLRVVRGLNPQGIPTLEAHDARPLCAVVYNNNSAALTSGGISFLIFALLLGDA